MAPGRLPHYAHITQLCGGRGSSALPPDLAAAAKVVACGAVWPNLRLRQAGYAITAACVHCGEEDSWEHRVLRCPRAAELREQMVDEPILEFLRGSPFAFRGLLEAPSDLLAPPVADGGVQFWCKDEHKLREEVFLGEVFVDGSCSKLQDRRANRAAWSVVVLDGAGGLYARLSGPVWNSLWQSSPMAEFVAVAAVIEIAAGPLQVVSDYSGAVAAFGGSSEIYLDKHKPLAGIVRSARCEPGWKHLERISKVQAHQATSGLQQGSEAHRLAVGNELADKWEKEALFRYQQADIHYFRQEDTIEVAKRFLCYAARLLQLWESPGKLQRLPKEEAKAARPIKVDGHQWVWASGLWRCSLCSRFSFLDPRGSAKRGPVCHGSNPALTEILAQRRGHKLVVHEVVGASGVVVLCCSACGRCTSRRSFSTLTWTCLGTPTKAGRVALAALGRGLHPYMQAEVGPAYLVPLQEGERP